MGNCNSSTPETKTIPVAGSPVEEPAKISTPVSAPTPNVSASAPTDPPAEEILKAEAVEKVRTAEDGKKVEKENGSTSDTGAKKDTDAAPQKLIPESKTGFLDDYSFGTDLGSGSFSVVKKVRVLNLLYREGLW